VGEKQPARKANNLTAIFELIVKNMLNLDMSQPYGHQRPVTSMILHIVEFIQP
jgi:hypothetical protein